MDKAGVEADWYVTDHALVRYLERVMKFDIEGLRRELADLVAPLIEAGATTYSREGYTYVLNQGRLTTVVPARQASRRSAVKNRVNYQKADR